MVPILSRLHPALARSVTAAVVVGIAVLAYRAYAWPGVALAAGGAVMWVLLHMTRMLTVLQRTSQRPIGSVASAVMFQARLEPGLTLLQLLTLAGSLGQRVDSMHSADPQTEQFQWSDASCVTVLCTLERGRLAHWELVRA